MRWRSSSPPRLSDAAALRRHRDEAGPPAAETPDRSRWSPPSRRSAMPYAADSQEYASRPRPRHSACASTCRWSQAWAENQRSRKNGRASGRERVGKYVYISVGGGYIKKKIDKTTIRL